MTSTDFIVARNDLEQCKLIETAIPDATTLPADALLVKVERFAFTANNVTYAVMGDELKYWQIFPAPQGFGNIPVWGFGEVIASKHPGVAVGERLFGYFPMATHLVIEAADVSKRGFVTAPSIGKQRLARLQCSMPASPTIPPSRDIRATYQALLRPLFMLSFLVDDFLAENDDFRREQRAALQRLQQDRVRACSSPAQRAAAR